MIFSRALVGSWYCLVWAFTRLSRCCWSCAALARAIRCHVFCNKPFNTRHYEERLLFLRGRCNSAWKFSAVSVASPSGKYDNSRSAWSLLAACACVVLHKYDNWQAVRARVVQEYDNYRACTAWKRLSLNAILLCGIVR